MKMRIWALLTALLLVCTLVGCGDKTDVTPTTGDTGGTSADSGDASVSNEVSTAYPDETVGFQLDMPQEGDTVVIMHTSMGDIAIRLFPEAAPKAVENFTTHAKEGYYDGLTFHRVIEDFMIQGGDPKGDGTGGESIWGDSFEDEFDQKLVNIRGSLAMANSGVDTNGSQFFINQAGPTGKTADQLKDANDIKSVYQQYAAYYGQSFTSQYPTADSFVEANLQNGAVDVDLVPDQVWELYAKVGGNIHLDGAWRHVGGHTVFGQVYAGMDIVDNIAAVEVDTNNKPKTAVTITSMEVTTYEG